MKDNLPRSFLTLPKKEKEIINKVMSEEVDRIVNAEEAEMQKNLDSNGLHYTTQQFQFCER